MAPGDINAAKVLLPIVYFDVSWISGINYKSHQNTLINTLIHRDYKYICLICYKSEDFSVDLFFIQISNFIIYYYKNSLIGW